jgi:hypothetical protein
MRAYRSLVYAFQPTGLIVPAWLYVAPFNPFCGTLFASTPFFELKIIFWHGIIAKKFAG